MAIFAEYYADGMIPEDVINVLYDISVTERPFTGSIEHISAASSIKEFNDKTLRTPLIANAILDGGNSDRDDTSSGIRYRQPMMLSDGNIKLGDQAQESDSFGNIAKFSTQLEDRTNELYRDQEANALSKTASVLPTDSVAGVAAGFFAQVKTATSFGATGADGGWNPGTGVFDAPTDGTTRALSETDLLGVMETANTNGADLDQVHMIPQLKTKFSGYMMSSSSRIGTLITQAPSQVSGATAIQSVEVYKTDHGAVEVMNNRIMQPENATPSSERTSVAVVMSEMAQFVDQWTARAKRLGPSGAGETWQNTCSGGMILNTERAHAAVRDIDYTADMVS
jgi:hypothetical protein